MHRYFVICSAYSCSLMYILNSGNMQLFVCAVEFVYHILYQMVFVVVTHIESVLLLCV